MHDTSPPAPRYYWQWLRYFGRECYKTGRWEFFTGEVVTIIAAGLITDSWKDVRTYTLATLIVFSGFAVWHLIKVPWILTQSRGSEYEPGTGSGLFGVSVIVLIVGLLFFLVYLRYQRAAALWDKQQIGKLALSFPLTSPIVSLNALPQTGPAPPFSFPLTPPVVPTNAQPQTGPASPSPVPPISPQFMTVGAMYRIVDAFYNGVRNFTPTTFIISVPAPSDQTWLQEDLRLVIRQACFASYEYINLKLLCSVEENVQTARTPSHQGLVIHVLERDIMEKVSPEKPEGLLLNSLYTALSPFFIIHKDLDFTEPQVNKLAGRHPTSNIVWIEIGTGPPWSVQDKRLTDGIRQEVIKQLEGWDVPLKDRLINAAQKMETSAPRAAMKYTSQRDLQDFVYVFFVLMDVEQKGFDTTEIRQLVIDAYNFKKPGDFHTDKIRAGLLDLSKRIP